MDGALRTASRTYGPAHFSCYNEVEQELATRYKIATKRYKKREKQDLG
jgi:hypothetical protein